MHSMTLKVYCSEGRVDHILFLYCSVYYKLITTYAGAFAAIVLPYNLNASSQGIPKKCSFR